MSRFLALVMVAGVALIIAHGRFAAPPPLPKNRAQCPPWARAAGDMRWTYWQVHYVTGHSATGGWGKWQCTPRPELTYGGAS